MIDKLYKRVYRAAAGRPAKRTRTDMEGRVTLRSFNGDDEEDVEAMAEWKMDEKASKYTTKGALKSKESMREFMKEVVMNHAFFMAICVDGRPVGAVSVTVSKEDPSASCRGEVGYMVSPKWWGRGVATVGVKMGIRMAFERMEHLLRIEALVEPSNAGSVRVLEKLGFVREGFLLSYLIMQGTPRDMLIYRYLRSDLHPQDT